MDSFLCLLPTVYARWFENVLANPSRCTADLGAFYFNLDNTTSVWYWYFEPRNIS